MDPDAALTEIRELIPLVVNGIMCDPSLKQLSDFEDDSTRLADLIQSLDEWISKGGFLPKEWRK